MRQWATIRVGLIRVITLSSPVARETHARWLTQHFPCLHVETSDIQGFPHGLHSPELVRRAVPAVLEAATELSAAVDVLAVSCTEDPGVEELRQRLERPVFGAGDALGCLCRALAVPIGVLTIAPELPEPLRRHLKGMEFAWRQVSGVTRTTDLTSAAPQIERAAKDLIGEGCSALALGCTGFSTAASRHFLQQTLPVPVLDPLVAMGAMIVASLVRSVAPKEVVTRT